MQAMAAGPDAAMASALLMADNNPRLPCPHDEKRSRQTRATAITVPLHCALARTGAAGWTETWPRGARLPWPTAGHRELPQSNGVGKTDWPTVGHVADVIHHHPGRERTRSH